jgi:hypothetical protein
MADRIFLDTAYFVALVNPNDALRERAQQLRPRVQNADEVFVTEAVLVEVANCLAGSEEKRAAASTLIRACYDTDTIRVVGITPELFQRGLELYEQRPDKHWGLTDCISFVVMQDHELAEAATHDHHFVQAGLVALLRQEGTG